MKAVMVMFDSLRRDLLEPYGCNWTITPNFTRLAQNSVTFDQSWAGSLPCMPARRELHTGRVNFYHRSWGPVEPYDDSMPQILKQNGIYSHLVSDHQHYWEDGGCTYHNRYSSWECARGQEGDKWKADLSVHYNGKTVFAGKRKMLEEDAGSFSSPESMFSHDEINRKEMESEEKTGSCRLRLLIRMNLSTAFQLTRRCILIPFWEMPEWRLTGRRMHLSPRMKTP